MPEKPKTFVMCQQIKAARREVQQIYPASHTCAADTALPPTCAAPHTKAPGRVHDIGLGLLLDASRSRREQGGCRYVTAGQVLQVRLQSTT